ncbi:hypothetical protein BASA60_002295 [Batrachochytrium salamandrivorans]|nr:hypothetical protein BASA60_002295 [Batrachochytrium salamandrivorans]
MALFVLAKESDTATTSIPMGAYVAGKPEGIRSNPYTTDMKVNPWTYGDLKTVMKFMMWVKCGHLSSGKSTGVLLPSMDFRQICMMPKQSAGNIVAMQNIIGGLMTQPCNPTFLSARDAIVAADASYYKGANKCEILKAFAKRDPTTTATPSPDPTTTDTPSPDPTTTDAPSPDPTTTDTPSPDPTTTGTTEETATTTTKETATTTGKASHYYY